ncbi:serine hydrolase domain-containing protein [Denitrobaculum tricleocarpae]|uniref:Beta-lactamase family protein n=1 Tax=Denitrobaculum tricleocarpae TaxID=2591009 RepID=A0A545TKX9_9PROT|nr:serine hydrolase domain-containing protein [Denitrobaculum tricleocarpae]TQV77882.1 beta-lactamase family protein [Denitrobaculum tricleocarpae]
MPSKRFAILFAAFISALASGSHPASAAPIDYDRLDQRLNRLAEDPGIVGLAVGVIEKGEITFARGYGETRIGGMPVTADTVFRWASLSKGVASSLTARLEAQGALSLSDKVAGFETSLRLPGGAERDATLENILSHRLGIIPNAYDTTLEDGRDPVEIRRSLGKLKAVCPIGDCHSYQNVAFDTVSEVVENVAQSSYGQALKTLLFKPLGMTNASIGRDSLQNAASWAEPHRYARGAKAAKRRKVKEAYYRVPAAGGVNGSIRDLALFARAQMGLVPEVLPQAQLDNLHSPRVYTRREQSRLSGRYGGHIRDARYALAWRVYKYSAEGYRVVGHRGAVDGYRSLILFDPALDTGVVVLWNSNSRKPTAIQLEVMDMAYGLPARDWLQLDQKASR